MDHHGVDTGPEAASTVDPQSRVPPSARAVFGDRLPLAITFVEMLARYGVERGLVGPREVDRLWERHLVNSAVVAELIPAGSRVVDVGSGAGFPGIPIAIARPDIDLVLLEPMARRVAWLEETVSELGLAVTVLRGRAEEPSIRSLIGHRDLATARAVAPLGRLAGWCLPLVAPGGRLLALKGSSAEEEITRDAVTIRRAGGGQAEIVRCGVAVAEETTVVVLPRLADTSTPVRSGRARRAGGNRSR